jgi:CheY-like chemotaxis protein
VVLIVEHDPKFADILLNMAHENGFKGVIATQGHQVLALARELKPDAITLDLNLPDMKGWAVLERLKQDRITRRIPVHVISVDDNVHHGKERGAYACLKKPVSKKSLEEAFAGILQFVDSRPKRLLVVATVRSRSRPWPPPPKP